jgi:hypothetical protein
LSFEVGEAMLVKIGRGVGSILIQMWSRGFFVSHLLVPLALLSFYFVVSSLLLPEGVNKVFVTRSAKYAVPIVVLLGAAYIATRRKTGLSRQPSSVPGAGLAPGDLILLLLPLTPVVQYLLHNNDILSRLEFALLFCFFALLATLPIIAVPVLLRRTGSMRPAMYMGLAFAFTLTNMASLSKQFAWHELGSLKIQLPVLAGVWLISWLLFQFKSRDLMHIAIAVYFAGNSMVQLYAREGAPPASAEDQGDNKLVTLIGAREPVLTPSIYLLVYDSYVVNETMSAYGFDNRVQEQYLEDLGFKIYPRTYSQGALSIASMSRVLNCSVSFYGNPRRAVSGDGVVQNLLGELGYETYGVFPTDYFFRGIVPSYDYSFPGFSSSASLLVEAILEGEFRFDIEFDKVADADFLREKEVVFADAAEGPRFIYTHSRKPGHSQGSGVCLPNQVELYGDALVRANLEMRRDLATILEADPEAIVIVAGDHGPNLTKNCMGTDEAYDLSEISRLDIQDRLGTFLAIKWPSEDFEEYDDITVLQDLFPVIFAYIFADPGILASRVEPEILDTRAISGANVVDGVIVGGIHTGQPLFSGGLEP